MTAPTLTDRLREQAHRLSCGEGSTVVAYDLLREAAAEIERLTSQLEAAGLEAEGYVPGAQGFGDAR